MLLGLCIFIAIVFQTYCNSLHATKCPVILPSKLESYHSAMKNNALLHAS